MTDRKIISPPTIPALASLFVAMVLIGLAPPAWAQTVAGSITAISGSATIQRGGATIPAAFGTKVDVGDHITTAAGSDVTITFTDNSQIELTDSSDLTLDQNTLNASGARASTKMTLLTGLVRSLVQTTPGTPPNYEVHTPNAVASARGTFYDTTSLTGTAALDFARDHLDKQYQGCSQISRVQDFKGTVEAYNPTNPSAPPVTLHDGQQVTIPCGSAPIFDLAQAAGGAGLGAAGWAAVAALGALGAGAIAVAVVGGTGGFGGGNNNNTPSPFTTDQ